MKRKFNLKKASGRKTFVLAALSLILVTMMAITATASWIEEVSQVEFSSTDGQETPLHVGEKVLKSDAVMKSNPTVDTVSLSDYFYKSGDMHLSPCYGDGDNFYFPLEGGGTGYRVGTKDDANVNYLSATFRIRSEGANTAYWFEKSVVDGNTLPFVSFKNGDTASNNTALTNYLRCSVTIDGATNVYSLNSNGSYITRENGSNATKTGKRIDQYTYYPETFNQNAPEGYYKNSANITNKPNQGAGNNLNGNTLFNVNKYDSQNKSTIKTVTVKIWLEYNSSSPNNSVVNVASVNMNFVSSWAKTRRVYVKDATVHQAGYDSAKWLSTYTDKLYFAVKSDMNNKHWLMSRIGSSDYYYADIPAVYNNAEAVFFRCSNSGWNSGNTTSYTANGVTVNCWNYWLTTFPDTFHSETYTVYTTDFATWEPSSEVNNIYFVDSQSFGSNHVYDYMWDHNSEHGSGINDKVVKNAEWPGKLMSAKMATQANGKDVYAFFYNADYDRIIFSDGVADGANKEFQTQDLWLTGNNQNWAGKTFDMATLTWFDTTPSANTWSSRIPTYSSSNTHIHGNFVTGNRWVNYSFAWGGQYGSTANNAFNGSSSTHMLCKIYCKAGNDYEFKLCYNGNWYGAYNDGDKRVTPNTNYYIDGTLIPNNYGLTLDNDHTSNFIMKGINAGDIIRIYFDTNEMKLYFAKGEN